MKRRYGVYGLQFGLVLATLVVIGMFTTLFGVVIEAGSIDTPPPGDAPPETDTEWNVLSISGAVLSVLGLAHVVVLPLSMYADTGFVRRTTGWRPLRILWVPLSAVPLLQIPVSVVYLLRRTYLLTLRPLLTGRQTGADSEATTAGSAPRTATDTLSTATDTPRTTTRDTGPPSVEESSPSLSQRIVSLLERIFDSVFYLLLSYFLGVGWRSESVTYTV
jgi:hypothetical protein